jgi:hypothetical protein
MSDDIVERLREYAEEWQIDRSVVDRAANEIIRLRALIEASVVLAQPGALTVNCVRGTVACQEAERLRARVGCWSGYGRRRNVPKIAGVSCLATQFACR